MCCKCVPRSAMTYGEVMAVVNQRSILGKFEISDVYLSDVQSLMFRFAVQRGDEKYAEQLLVDWGFKKKVKQVYITKWIPGRHYYALDEKFNTYGDAISHLESEGYESLGVKETRIPQEGD